MAKLQGASNQRHGFFGSRAEKPSLWNHRVAFMVSLNPLSEERGSLMARDTNDLMSNNEEQDSQATHSVILLVLCQKL